MSPAEWIAAEIALCFALVTAVVMEQPEMRGESVQCRPAAAVPSVWQEPRT